MQSLESFLAGIVGKVQADAKPYFTPLADLGDSTTNVVNVGGTPFETSGDSGGWTRTIAVPAAANLRFSVIDDGSLAALDLAPAAGQRCLALALRANVGLDVEGQYPTGPFAAQGAASAASSCDLQWIFSHDASTKVADALKADAAALKDPFSLDALFALRAVPQWRQARVEVDGAVSTTLGLSAGVADTRALSVSGLAQVPVCLQVGLSGTANVQLAGLVHLSATRDDQGLRVRLGRGTKQSALFGLELGAQADISAWLTDTAGLLASTLPDPDNLPASLQACLEPGSWLAGVLGDAVDARFAPGSGENLVARIALGLAPGADANANAGVVAKIGSLVDEELQSGQGRLGGRLGALLGNALPASLNSGGGAGAAIVAKVEDWLAKKANVVQLAADLAGRIQKAGGLQPVIDHLGGFGAHLQARLGGAFQGVEQLTSALRQAIGDYAAARTRLLDTLAEAATRKLGLVFGAQYGQERDDSALLDIVFRRSTPATKALFDAISRGRLDDLERRLAAAGDDIAAASGTLRQRLERTRGESVSLQLIGKDIGWTARTAATLDVSATLAGDIVAVSTATGEASAQQASVTFFGHFDTTLACVFIAGTDAGGRPANTIGFRGAYSFAGDRLDSDRLLQLLEVMAPLCKLPPAADLARRLGLPGDASSSLQAALSNLDLVLPLDLAAGEVASVTSSPHSFEDVADVLMSAADAAYPNVLHDTRLSDAIREAARNSTPGGLRAVLTWAAGSTSDDIVEQMIGGPTSVSGADFRYSAARAIRKIGALAVGIDTMRREFAALGAVQAATLKDNPAAAADVMSRLSRIADALRPAAVSGVDEHGKTWWLPWTLTAFAQALAMLAGRPMPGGFVPVAKVDTGGASRTFVLTNF
jgi:hypothetical protein